MQTQGQTSNAQFVCCVILRKNVWVQTRKKRRTLAKCQRKFSLRSYSPFYFSVERYNRVYGSHVWVLFTLFHSLSLALLAPSFYGILLQSSFFSYPCLHACPPGLLRVLPTYFSPAAGQHRPSKIRSFFIHVGKNATMQFRVFAMATCQYALLFAPARTFT